MNRTLKDEITELHAQVCSALADPNRILILYTLAESPLHVSALAQELEIPQPTVSRHLKILKDRGMVTSLRDGQIVIYTIRDKRVIEALDLMRGLLADRLNKNSIMMQSTL